MEIFLLHIYLDIQTIPVTPTLTTRHTHMIKHIVMVAQAAYQQPAVVMRCSRTGDEFELEPTRLPRLLRSGHCKAGGNCRAWKLDSTSGVGRRKYTNYIRSSLHSAIGIAISFTGQPNMRLGLHMHPCPSTYCPNAHLIPIVTNHTTVPAIDDWKTAIKASQTILSFRDRLQLSHSPISIRAMLPKC